MVLEVLGFFAGFFIAFIGVSYLRLYANPELRSATSLSQLYPSNDEMFGGFVLLTLFFLFLGLMLISLGNAIIGGIIVGFGSGFFFHPFYLLRLVRQRRRAAEEVDHLRGLDSQVLRVAKEYGGILSASHLVYELELSLEEALAALTRFVKYGEAREIEVSPGVRIWDFPIARAHLAKSDREVIDKLKTSPDGMTKTELLSQASLSLKAIEETLSRLTAKGILIHDPITDKHRLRGMTL